MRQGHRACAAAISFAACFGISSFAAAAVPQVPSLPTTTAGYVKYAITDEPNYYKTQPVSGTNNTPASNSITDAGATLGRVLFYDKRLSHDNGGSCASCHKQSKGFSDENQFSAGINGQLTTRHSMGLTNVAFFTGGKMFWDERAASIEAQALVPIQSATEMGSTLTEVITKLNATTFYPSLFTAAFGDSAVTSDRISKAIAQFERSMVSYNSEFDAQLKAPQQSIFDDDEAQGQILFNGKAKCSGCHATNARSMDILHNIGLDGTKVVNSQVVVDGDAGAGNGKFKAPSLRNVEVRGRYMHDGRFSTLEQVVEFYSSQVINTQFTDGPFTNDFPLHLSDSEKRQLVAYLKTFTDQSFLTNSLFSDPFVNLPGDYDGDGVVTTSDYIVWRKSVGDTISLVADGNGDHKVDNGDYDIWRQNLGKTWQSLATGSGSAFGNTSVPEPTSLALAAIAVIFGLNSRRIARRASCRSADNSGRQQAKPETL
jgi:cytochrome c peroxidase